jgi:hypothetical protein
MDPYWGQLNLLIFLTKAEIDRIFLEQEIRAHRGNFNIVHCPSADSLLSNLKALDTPENKVIKFFGHGNAHSPGTIVNAAVDGLRADLLPELNGLQHKGSITLDFMSVCFQHNIPLRDFRHLVTTSEKMQKAVSLQGLGQSVKLYSQPYSQDRISSIEGKLGYYKVHN